MAANGADLPGPLQRLACPGSPEDLLDETTGELITHSFAGVQLFLGRRELGQGPLLVTTRHAFVISPRFGQFCLSTAARLLSEPPSIHAGDCCGRPAVNLA